MLEKSLLTIEFVALGSFIPSTLQDLAEPYQWIWTKLSIYTVGTLKIKTNLTDKEIDSIIEKAEKEIGVEAIVFHSDCSEA